MARLTGICSPERYRCPAISDGSSSPTNWECSQGMDHRSTRRLAGLASWRASLEYPITRPANLLFFSATTIGTRRSRRRAYWWPPRPAGSPPCPLAPAGLFGWLVSYEYDLGRYQQTAQNTPPRLIAVERRPLNGVATLGVPLGPVGIGKSVPSFVSHETWGGGHVSWST